jgi:hypothetical protein
VVAHTPQEYLVSHGTAGDFGRFRTVVPLTCRRGERVVIQGERGLELGAVLCEASARHARLLPQAPVGELLRRATAEDEQTARRMRERGQAVFEDGRRLAGELGLPLEVLDVDLSLDGRQGVVYFLGKAGLGIDPFAAELSRRHGLFVLLHNLAQPVHEEEAGCGKPDCGKTGGGGCSDCGTGGCATGCGTGKADMTAYFAHLRAKMDKRNLRPLL